MKTWVIFNPGEDPLEVDEYDHTLMKRDAYFYNSKTGKWYMMANSRNYFNMPIGLVPTKYQAWILVL